MSSQPAPQQAPTSEEGQAFVTEQAGCEGVMVLALGTSIEFQRHRRHQLPPTTTSYQVK